WIHGAAASAFSEPTVGTLHSPLSTYFYGIHGLVDYWWKQWEKLQKRALKDIIDSKVRVKEFKDHKEFFKEHKELIADKIQPDKHIKEKDKDIFEAGGLPVEGGDPGWLLSDLDRRISDLEIRVTQQAFIRPEERPPVGEAANKEKEKTPKKDK